MRRLETRLQGPVLIEPAVHGDARGFFVETYRQGVFAEFGVHDDFVQDNHSRSRRGTLRGLHFQRTRPQGKLIRVVEGEIYDVAADVNPRSPTFRQWVGVTLSADSFRQMYVPPAYAHGFCVTSEVAQVEYKCTDYYDPVDEAGVMWNDEFLAIDWPIADPVLSRRDQQHPPLSPDDATALHRTNSA